MCLFLVLFCITYRSQLSNVSNCKYVQDQMLGPNHLISFHNFQRFHFFDIVRTIFRFPAQEDKCEVIIHVQLQSVT